MNISKVKKVCRFQGHISVADLSDERQFVGVCGALYHTGGIKWSPEQLCEMFDFDYEKWETISIPCIFSSNEKLFEAVTPFDTIAFPIDASVVIDHEEYVGYKAENGLLVLRKKLLEPVIENEKVAVVRNGKLIIADISGAPIGVFTPEPRVNLIELCVEASEFVNELRKVVDHND